MITSLELLPENNSTAVALGFFDGVHLGHRNVISGAANSKSDGLVPLCLTFAESPKSIISGKNFPSLMTREDKLSTLTALGIEKTITADFRQIMNLSAECFVADILVNRLKAKKLFCGFNYRFGKNAEGGVDTLKKLCGKFGVEVFVISPVSVDGNVVSSTLIKSLITKGELAYANKMLGSLFGFSREITHGRKLGRQLGTPTLNQPLGNNLIVPKFGVYASMVTLESGKKYCGVTNVGIKPTVGSDCPLWETWMPLYHGGELYGQTADVRLIDFIRPEHCFDSLDALKAEIMSNGKTALEIFQNIKTDL